MGFDPDAYLAKIEGQGKGGGGGFDPDAYLAKFDAPSAPKEEENQPATTGGWAYLDHTANALTFGHLPQLQGKAQQYLPDPSKNVDQDLETKGFKISQPKFNDYVSARDEGVKRLEQEESDHPVASMLGTGTGMIASSVGVGAAARAIGAGAKALQLVQAAKAAQAAGDMALASKLTWLARAARAGNAVTIGAVQGAAQNPGDTAGKVDAFQVGQRLENAKNGALTGLALQGSAEAAPALAKAGVKFAGTKLGQAAIGGAIGYRKDGWAGAGEGALLALSAGKGASTAEHAIGKVIPKHVTEAIQKFGPKVVEAIQNNPAIAQRLLQGVVSPTENEGYSNQEGASEDSSPQPLSQQYALNDADISAYARKHNLARDMANHILSQRDSNDLSAPTNQERMNAINSLHQSKKGG